MTDTVNREKILDRVRKMLALANDDGAAEGERDNALRMAHNTLAKYEMSLIELDAHTREKEDPRGRFDTEGWNLLWCRYVRQTVARLFGCEYLQGGKINATKGRHIYIGRTSNTATAAYMSDYIIQGMLKEADKRYGHRLTPDGRSFCTGVSDRLRVRVRELQEANRVELEATPGTALVLADYWKAESTANNEWMYANMRIGKARAVGWSSVHAGSYHAGKEHANSINLSRQLSGKNAPGLSDWPCTPAVDVLTMGHQAAWAISCKGHGEFG